MVSSQWSRAKQRHSFFSTRVHRMGFIPLQTVQQLECFQLQVMQMPKEMLFDCRFLGLICAVLHSFEPDFLQFRLQPKIQERFRGPKRLVLEW